MRGRFGGKLGIVMIMLVLVWLLPNPGGEVVAAQERYKTEVEFDFKYEPAKARVVPQVRVTKIYFDDGHANTTLYEFPKQARMVSKDAQYSEEARMKDDPLLQKTFYPGCGWGYGTHVLDSETGPQAFTIYCDSTTNKKANAKGDKESVINVVLYGYDVNSNRLSILNQGQTDDMRRTPIDLYATFGGYAMLGPYGEERYDERQTRVYSLIGNKLITRTAEHPDEDLDSGTLRFTEYKRTSDDPKVLEKMDDYVTAPYGHFTRETIVLKRDGTRGEPAKHHDFLPENIYSQEKIGPYTYVGYKKPNSEQFMVGYRTSANSAIKPLSRADASSAMWFSKYRKFMMIRQQTPTGKTLRIIDTKTAKMISEIPDIGGAYYEEVGDSIILFGFESKHYYMHLPTGIITRNMDNAQRIRSDADRYVGDQSKLVSLQAPPEMFINGKRMRFKGQGPFLTLDNRWYVEINDFAQAAGASVSQTSSGLKVKRGAYQMTISKTDKAVLSWAGQTFVSLETINEKLGMVGGFMDSILSQDFTHRVIRVFSKDLKETDVIAQPQLFEQLDLSGFATDSHYYVMQNGKPAAKPLLGVTAYAAGWSRLIFKDGILVNVAAVYNVDGRTLRNIIFDLNYLKHVIAAYGTPKATKTGGQMVRWYEVEGNVLVFESTSHVNSAYYIAR